MSDLIEQLRQLAHDLDAEREHVTAVRDHLAQFLPEDRDSISFDHLRKAGDLGRHISARIAALIDELSRPNNPQPTENKR